ncbi:MAG: DUF192 domain-containing protein [Candidatus Micrarchaeota archaeon]
MNNYEVIFIFLILVLVLLIAYLITAKGDRKKIILVNSDGQQIEIEVEIANNSATKAKGLMGRISMAENDGMLFIFDNAGKYGFWMFNTSLELEAIHFADNGTVVDIIQMKPNTISMYYPKNDSKYVLEVLTGFSKRNSIKIGKSSLIIE